MTLPCPYCRKRLTITEREIMSEAGRISGRRGTPGRKPVMRQCPKCGGQHAAREMRRCKK